MEKIFFAIVRWFLMFILLLALLIFIGAGTYAIKLYIDTQNTSVMYEGYEQKSPTINANTLIQEYEDKDNIKKEEFEKIKKYVVSVMENGSSGHDYSKGDMPGKLVKDKNTTNQIASYIAGGLKEKAPNLFVSCVSCHGYDGLGMYGESPNLKELPIYHKKRLKVLPPKKEEAKIVEKKIEQKPVKSEFDKIVDLITVKINEYAKLAKQGEANKDKLRDFLAEQLSLLAEENKQQYVSQLLDSFNQLIQHEKGFMGKKKNDTAYKRKPIVWLDFLIKFTDQFNTEISNEQLREAQYEAEYRSLVSEKLDRATTAQIQLIFVLQVLSGALVSFVILTIMLVLLRIEINTRNCIFISKPEEDNKNEN